MFCSEIAKNHGPEAAQKYAGEMREMANLYDGRAWRDDEYVLFQIVMLSILSDDDRPPLVSSCPAH
jgi:hypothetical protein